MTDFRNSARENVSLRGNRPLPHDETAREIAEWRLIDEYIAGLKWSGDTDDYAKTLVAGNIRGFYAWLRGHGRVQAEPERTAEPPAVESITDSRRLDWLILTLANGGELPDIDAGRDGIDEMMRQ